MFVILYLFSLIALLWTFFFRMLITSDIPPSFTMDEVYLYYISSLIMFFLFLLTIRKALSSRIKNIITLLPVLLMFIFYLSGTTTNITNYVYYSNIELLMDITF